MRVAPITAAGVEAMRDIVHACFDYQKPFLAAEATEHSLGELERFSGPLARFAFEGQLWSDGTKPSAESSFLRTLGDTQTHVDYVRHNFVESGRKPELDPALYLLDAHISATRTFRNIVNSTES